MLAFSSSFIISLRISSNTFHMYIIHRAYRLFMIFVRVNVFFFVHIVTEKNRERTPRAYKCVQHHSWRSPHVLVNMYFKHWLFRTVCDACSHTSYQKETDSCCITRTFYRNWCHWQVFYAKHEIIYDLYRKIHKIYNYSL